MNERPVFASDELAVAGQPITAITLDSDVVIFAGEHRDYEFRIEQGFEVTPPDGESFNVQFEPYGAHPLVPRGMDGLACIIATTIIEAVAYMDGTLELLLSDGTKLVVGADPKYEAWTYAHGNYILPCTPGGFGPNEVESSRK